MRTENLKGRRQRQEVEERLEGLKIGDANLYISHRFREEHGYVAETFGRSSDPQRTEIWKDMKGGAGGGYVVEGAGAD